MVKEQKVPEWFNGVIYDKGDIVANRFSGEKIELIKEKYYEYTN